MQEFNFVLEGFALQNLRPKFFRPGSYLNAGHSDFNKGSYAAVNDLNSSMSTLQDGKVPTSLLGTPVFCDMILQTDEPGATGSQGESIQLLWVLCTVDMNKLIVKEQQQGRDGTVKDYISDGDFEINIRGGLTSGFSNAYPKEESQRLIRLLKIKKSLKVVSEYMRLFSIYELVVENYSFPQKEGLQNVQLFDLKCVSDTAIQLRRKRS